MFDSSTVQSVTMAWDDAVCWLTEQLGQSGLSVVRTFDLQQACRDPRRVARQAQVDCPCPHHGTQQCDCQMLVLLVYDGPHRPLTLIAHGYDGQTWFSVVNTPEQRADPALEAAIRRSLAALVPAEQVGKSVRADADNGQ